MSNSPNIIQKQNISNNNVVNNRFMNSSSGSVNNSTPITLSPTTTNIPSGSSNVVSPIVNSSNNGIPNLPTSPLYIQNNITNKPSPNIHRRTNSGNSITTTTTSSSTINNIIHPILQQPPLIIGNTQSTCSSSTASSSNVPILSNTNTNLNTQPPVSQLPIQQQIHQQHIQNQLLLQQQQSQQTQIINNNAPLRKKYKPLQRNNATNHDLTAFYGWIIIICTLTFFIFSTYCLIFSKLLPDTGNRILDFIKYDWYYCLLLPVIIPVTIITVYFNWLSLKFFRHN